MHPAARSRQRAPWRVVTLAFAACCAAAQPQAPTANFVLNGQFEHGNAHWVLTDSKGRPGGTVVETANGNHALGGSAGAYWLGATDYHYFAKLGLERLAGGKLVCRFSVKGDEDACPGLLLSCVRDGKSWAKTVFWKTKYAQYDITLSPQFKQFERVVTLPKGVTKVMALSLYNATRRGEIWFDNIWLGPADDPKQADASKQAIAAYRKPWAAVALTERELIELSNTHNFLATQWALLYGRVVGLERVVHYADAAQPLAAPTKKAIDALGAELWDLRLRLMALEAFYVDEFGKRYRVLLRNSKGAFTPWKFYRHDNYAGRKLLFEVGAKRSDKAPAADLEKRFERARARAAALLVQCQAHFKAATGYAPIKSVRHAPAGPMFDDRGRPRRIVMGVRDFIEGCHARRWLDADFDYHAIYPVYDPDDPKETMRIGPGTNPFQAETDYYDLRHGIFIFADPRMRREAMRPSFKQKLCATPEWNVYTEFGPHMPGQYRGRGAIIRYYPNIFHPAVQAHLKAFYEEYWRLFGNRERPVFLEYAAEPTFYMHHEGKSAPYGYSPAAKRVFRGMLRKQFDTIQRLNASWGTSYASFDAIQPPTYDMMQAMKPERLPLIYEFRRFRKLGYSRHFKMIYDAAHRGARKPVVTRMSRTYFNGNSLDALDTYRMAQATDVCCHHGCNEGTYKHFAEQVYGYSIARYLGHKPRGSLEFYIACPEANTFNFDKDDKIVLFRRSVNNLWRAFIWDEKLLCPWLMSTHAGLNWKGANYLSGCTLQCLHAAAMPLMKTLARDALEPILFSTHIVQPKLGMIAPYDGTMVCQPDDQMATEGKYVHKFLSERNYDYLCVPEELIADGREQLTDYAALIAPYMLWAPRATQEALLRWVEQGGILVAIGPLGAWDEYGRPSRVLIDKAFGPIPMTMNKTDVYRAAFAQNALAHSDKAVVETLLPCAKGKQVNLISAAYGKGRIYITADPSVRGMYSATRNKLLAAIDDAIGVRTAWCQNRAFELVTRENPESAERYLFAINPSVLEPRDDTIMVLGEYERPLDVAVPGGCPIAAKRFGGVTALRVWLAPGEATCIRLGAFRQPTLDKEQIAKITGDAVENQRSAVLRELAKVENNGDPVAYSMAMTCRQMARFLMAEGAYALALDYANQAAARCAAKVRALESGFTPSLYCDAAPTIDGRPGDWPGAPWTRFGTGRFKSMWDDENLYFLVEVKDSLLRNDEKPGALWSGDCVEIYLDVLNQGGSRPHGPLDFQYVVASTGRVQLRNVERAAPAGTRAAAAKTDDGYRIEVAIANSETCLCPAPGRVLAFNVRQLDFGLKQGRFCYLGDQILKRTEHHPGSNVLGWPKLKLTGAAPLPGVEYVAATNTILLRGRGHSLRSIARQLDNPALLRYEANLALLAANLRLADRAQLVFRAERLKAAGNASVRITAGRRTAVHLVGDAIIEGVDAQALKACQFTSYGAHRLDVSKPIKLQVNDIKGHPIVNIAVGIRATDKRTGDVALAEDFQLDAKGRTVFALPAWSVEVSDGRAKVLARRYDLSIEDRNFTVLYSIEDFDASATPALTVVFKTFRE